MGSRLPTEMCTNVRSLMKHNGNDRNISFTLAGGSQ